MNRPSLAADFMFGSNRARLVNIAQQYAAKDGAVRIGVPWHHPNLDDQEAISSITNDQFL